MTPMKKKNANEYALNYDVQLICIMDSVHISTIMAKLDFVPYNPLGTTWLCPLINDNCLALCLDAP